MKSSVKSNATMKSSTMLTSRSTASILTMSKVSNNMKEIPEKQVKKAEKTVNQPKPTDKRKSIGPISFVSLSTKVMNKNQSSVSVAQNAFVNNVDVIESEGSDDEFF